MKRICTAKNFLLCLLVFLGLGALVGGGMLMLCPDGQWMRMPLSMLRYSPFSNFLIPGIVLFLMLGVAPLLLVIVLQKKPASVFAEKFNAFKDMHWSWTYTVYNAILLVLWIQVEMQWLRAVHWIHDFYILLALAILFTALLPAVKDLYKKPS